MGDEVFVAESILKKAFPYIGMGVAGVGGWFLTNLYGRSLLRYWEVKQAICKSLVSHGLIVKVSDRGIGVMPGGVSWALDDDSKRHNVTVDERCSLNLQQAGELVAAFNGMPRPLQWWYSSFRGENVEEARKMLVGMSNADGSRSQYFDHLASYRNGLIGVLNLKGV